MQCHQCSQNTNFSVRFFQLIFRVTNVDTLLTFQSFSFNQYCITLTKLISFESIYSLYIFHWLAKLDSEERRRIYTNGIYKTLFNKVKQSGNYKQQFFLLHFLLLLNLIPKTFIFYVLNVTMNQKSLHTSYILYTSSFMQRIYN